MATTEPLKELFEYIDAHKAEYIERLAECVAIDGVSGDPARRERVVDTMKWAGEWMTRLGIKVEFEDIGTQTLADGTELPLPPIILGTYECGVEGAQTLMVYGHLDVQPASVEDGWDTDPWVLTERDGKLYGRGSTDDKAPVLGWLWAIEAHQKVGATVPVNIRFVLEGMEESGSVGLDTLVEAQAQPGKHLDPAVIDHVCISDNYWLGTSKPCITYGLRGICYFELEVVGGAKDLHSGVLGGPIAEANSDLFKVMASLTGPKGDILVPGVMDSVAPVTPDEAAIYENIDFDPEQFKADAGVPATGKLRYSDKATVLQKRWRFPSLSLHGIEGAWAGAGAKTVIPGRVVGKFSIRLVPHQDPAHIVECVRAHVAKQFEELDTGNQWKLSCGHGAPAWMADINAPVYVAARRATKIVHGVEPDLTREGGSIPITLTFQRCTGKQVLLLPIGAGDDGAHSQNEKIGVDFYMNGIKLFTSFFHELAKAASEASS